MRNTASYSFAHSLTHTYTHTHTHTHTHTLLHSTSPAADPLTTTHLPLIHACTLLLSWLSEAQSNAHKVQRSKRILWIFSEDLKCQDHTVRQKRRPQAVRLLYAQFQASVGGPIINISRPHFIPNRVMNP
jgi:hypothetical protein